jgi:Concanavalin A-like lectin/glucanases superfamily
MGQMKPKRRLRAPGRLVSNAGTGRRTDRGRCRRVRLVSASAAVALALGVSSASVVAGAAPPAIPQPVLWNTFQSPFAITHSQIGPPLAFYSSADCPGRPECGSFDVKANPAFVAGYLGEGLTIGPGAYSSEQREHNVVLRHLGDVLSIDQGTISVWFKQNTPAVPFVNGVYRIFDGAFGLESGVGLWVSNSRLFFDLSGFGNDVPVVSVTDGETGVHDGTSTGWRHLVAVWDRTGIAGSTDTLRLYVNGRLVARSSDATWGGQIGSTADIGGGNDGKIASAFVIDRLKLFTTPVLPHGMGLP